MGSSARHHPIGVPGNFLAVGHCAAGATYKSNAADQVGSRCC